MKPQIEAPLKYKGVKIDLTNCILPDSILSKQTPSEIDGLDAQTETALRATGCEFISLAGILLRLPQTAMATAQVLFQRYFYAKSFVKHDMEVLSMAATWLASKIEEEPRRARDVINVYTRIKQKRDNLDIVPVVVDDAYKRKKDDLVKAERFMLKELGFCVHVKHPHKLIVIIVKQILGYHDNHKLVQTAWNFMNDSFRSRHLFVKYAPEKIACGCIFLAARVLQVPTTINPYWFEPLDVEPAEVFQICQHIMKLYTFENVPIDSLLMKVRQVQEENRRVLLEARKRKHSASKNEKIKENSKNLKKQKNKDKNADHILDDEKSGYVNPVTRLINNSSDLRGSSRLAENIKKSAILNMEAEISQNNKRINGNKQSLPLNANNAAQIMEQITRGRGPSITKNKNKNPSQIDLDSSSDQDVPDGRGGYISKFNRDRSKSNSRGETSRSNSKYKNDTDTTTSSSDVSTISSDSEDSYKKAEKKKKKRKNEKSNKKKSKHHKSSKKHKNKREHGSKHKESKNGEKPRYKRRKSRSVSK